MESEQFGEDTEVLSLSALREVFARLEEREGVIKAESGQPPDSAKVAPNTSLLSVFGNAAEIDSSYDGGEDWGEGFVDDDFAQQGAESENGETGEGAEKIGVEMEVSDSGSEYADPVPVIPETILEAMLFVGDRENRPLTATKAAELMRNVEPEEIDELVARLNSRYAEAGRPYRIIPEKGGYRLGLTADSDTIRTKFHGRIKEARLSQQAIDILALVAYRQPITTEEVQMIRKQPSGTILTQLVRRGLLGIERNTEAKRPVLYYRTTARFLELFGLDSLDDLPTPDEIDYR